MEKAIKYYGGNASRVKDIARNTIVVQNKSQHEKAVSLLKEHGAKVKTIDPASDPMGYSGTNAVVNTKAGIHAEVQVNTPEMIFAKEPAEKARAILGEDLYAKIATRTGVPGGRGHELYEKYRELRPGDARAAELAAESKTTANAIKEPSRHQDQFTF